MLKSKTIQTLFGVFVLSLLLWIIGNLWYVPNLGNFSCDPTPWFLTQGQARADTGDGCPSSLDEAWSDPVWAAERFAGIKGDDKTAGWYYDDSGQPHKVSSGDLKGADTERARRILRERGAVAARDGSYPAAHHVEVKVAAMMRENGAKQGVVVINNDRGPCAYNEGLSCQEVLPLVLPRGAMLRVWWPGKDETMQSLDFTGR